MKPEILLDMDGVLSDFFTAAFTKLTSLQTDPMQKYDYVRHQEFDMAKVFGITQETFWSTIDQDSFWLDLKPFLWAPELYRKLSEYGRVTICSSPSLNPNCIPQKLAWLKQHLNLVASSCLFGGRKELMAGGNKILIDDYPKNVEKFRAAGGKAILVPSNWNTVNLTYTQVLSTILAEL